MSEFKFVNVNSENIAEVGPFCIKNKKAEGYKKKVAWFKNKLNTGLKMKIVLDNNEKQVGFIEYIPSELAWRPISAENYYFIHCIAMFGKNDRNKSVGSELIKICETEAKENNMSGICAMSSKGPWIANKTIFEKNGFEVVDELGRFQLMAKRFDKKVETPKFNDWNKRQKKYKGWNLVYSDQCPWHEKSILGLEEAAKNRGIKLKVKKVETPKEAQKAPSGFGTFSLLKDGKLLADHYISKTRFESIIKSVEA